jgi:hypothetical protein
MYKKFLTARSPLRLLEKGLHGGLGRGNLGLVIAGHGVGKTSFLVGVALDDLMRGDHVLHVVLDQTVAHTRDYYDTVFDELATSTQMQDEATVHADVDRRRSIRAYPPTGFDASKLGDAIALEHEAGSKPALVIVEGIDPSSLGAGALEGWRAIARDLPAEIWISAAGADENAGVPAALQQIRDEFDVILALEPESDGVALRALKDHDNPDTAALRVALDPRTLLLKRG